MLNLFGVEYTPEYYMGRDILDKSYKGYVFFSDYSWYDGNAYVEGGEVSNGAAMDVKALEEMNTLINDLIRKNDMTLKYDYFRRIYKAAEKTTKEETSSAEGEDETTSDSMGETEGEAVE